VVRMRTSSWSNGFRFFAQCCRVHAYKAITKIRFEECIIGRTSAPTARDCRLRETENMPSVKHLFRAARKRLPMEELPEVRVADNSGFEGCAHARPDSPVKSC